MVAPPVNAPNAAAPLIHPAARSTVIGRWRQRDREDEPQGAGARPTLMRSARSADSGKTQSGQLATGRIRGECAALQAGLPLCDRDYLLPIRDRPMHSARATHIALPMWALRAPRAHGTSRRENDRGRLRSVDQITKPRQCVRCRTVGHWHAECAECGRFSEMSVGHNKSAPLAPERRAPG